MYLPVIILQANFWDVCSPAKWGVKKRETGREVGGERHTEILYIVFIGLPTGPAISQIAMNYFKNQMRTNIHV